MHRLDLPDALPATPADKRLAPPPWGEAFRHVYGEFVAELPRPVQVLHEDGRWYDGWLEGIRRDRDGWQGFVRFTTGPDERRLLWFGEDRIRAPDVSQ